MIFSDFSLKNKRFKAGFTLIELLVVISIIGILASTLAINVGKWRARTRDAKRIAEVRAIQHGLLFYFYRSEYSGNYPIGDVYLDGSDSVSVELLNYGAMTTIPLDPFNEGDFRYYYCSYELDSDCSISPGTGQPDGDSYILMYYLETGAIAGTNKHPIPNYITP